MESLQSFWTWMYILGVGSFYLLVLAVIPLGFRDLLHLFRDLNQGHQDVAEGEPDAGSQ